MRGFKKITIINAICLVVLMVAGYNLTSSINECWDVIGADELSYLKLGKNLFQEVHFDWGFTYNLWYKFLSVFSSTTVELYYKNYKVLITLIPVLLFVCLLIYDIHSVIAFVVSILYLISKLHLTTWPFVSDFCIVLILAYFISIRFINDNGWKVIFLSFISLLLYLTRPEYIIAFIIAICVSLYLNQEHKKRWIVLLAMIGAVMYIGNNTTKIMGIDRAFFAFAQHYAITYKIWHKNTVLDIYGYIKGVPLIFGKSFTLLGSICYNPLEALRHILTCFGFYIMIFLKSTEDLLLPSSWFQMIGKFKHVLFFCLIVSGIVWYKKNEEHNRFRKDSVFYISLFVFFIAGAIPNFLIGYTPHYFQLHFILYVLFFCIVLFKQVHVRIKVWMLVIILLFFAMPSLKNYSFIHVDISEHNNLPIQRLTELVNKINDKKSHCLLAYQTNIQFVFEDNNFRGFDIFSINKPFLRFVEENKVDYIYINQQFLKDERLNKDNEWKCFFADPGKYDFVKHEIRGTRNYLLIKVIK